MSEALGGKAIPMASLEECKAADAIIAVKRIHDRLLANIRASKKPWAWDVVDAYPQPQCSSWGRSESIAWLQSEVKRLKPDLIIFPNARMRDDFGSGAVIYHHHRPGIERNPIRERIETIGYEGSPRYIESWMPAIADECKKRGASFVVNPPRLADVDVVLALRGIGWSGYPQRHYKSNVKLANAHGSGTPFIGAMESGYLEKKSGRECWVDSKSELTSALDLLAPQEVRKKVSARFLECAYPIEKAAADYRKLFNGSHDHAA